MTDHEPPTTVASLLADLGEEYTRAVALPLPKDAQALGWQMIAATRTAGFAHALYFLNEEDPNRADEVAAWFDGPFGEGPDLPECTDWLVSNVAESQAQTDGWVENGRKQAVAAELAAGEQRDAYVKQLAALVRDLAQAGPCYLDARGRCPGHNWFEETPCPHGRAQALFPDIKES